MNPPWVDSIVKFPAFIYKSGLKLELINACGYRILSGSHEVPYAVLFMDCLLNQMHMLKLIWSVRWSAVKWQKTKANTKDQGASKSLTKDKLV